MPINKEKYAIVSRYVIDQGAAITWFFREEPMDKDDSGWHAFTGLENDEFFDNENNFLFYSLEKLIEIDPSLEPLLENNIGTDFERESPETPWEEAKDEF